jgi:hypothetical protein
MLSFHNLEPGGVSPKLQITMYLNTFWVWNRGPGVARRGFGRISSRQLDVT